MKNVGNRNRQQFDAEVLSKLFGVFDASSRGKLRWHQDAGNIAAAQGIHRDTCGERRVDAAA